MVVLLVGDDNGDCSVKWAELRWRTLPGERVESDCCLNVHSDENFRFDEEVETCVLLFQVR